MHEVFDVGHLGIPVDMTFQQWQSTVSHCVYIVP